MNFYETRLGQHFFNVQLPKLTEALENVASALSHPTPSIKPPNMDDPDFLSNLYYNLFDPDQYQPLEKMKSINKLASQSEKALREELTPHGLQLLDAYETNTFARGDMLSELAFEAGFRMAVQMILAGVSNPQNAKGDSHVSE